MARRLLDTLSGSCLFSHRKVGCSQEKRPTLAALRPPAGAREVDQRAKERRRPTEGRVDRNLRRLVRVDQIKERSVVRADAQMSNAGEVASPLDHAGGGLLRLSRKIDPDRRRAHRPIISAIR